MIWKFGVALVVGAVVLMVVTRTFVRRESHWTDPLRLAAMTLRDVGVALTFGGAAIAWAQDGQDTLHRVVAGVLGLLAAACVAKAGLIVWAYLRVGGFPKPE